MTQEKPDARRRILDAAEELARDAGPGNLALDAVAARAGVSKGGLLYHFPSKSKLLEALVERFLGSLDESLKEKELESAGAPNSVTRAYLDLFIQEHKCNQPPPSGLLAALNEDPSFLNPVRKYERMFLDRMKTNARDPNVAVIVFLVLHGIRNMELLNMDLIDDQEFCEVATKLRELTSSD